MHSKCQSISSPQSKTGKSELEGLTERMSFQWRSQYEDTSTRILAVSEAEYARCLLPFRSLCQGSLPLSKDQQLGRFSQLMSSTRKCGQVLRSSQQDVGQLAFHFMRRAGTT